MATSKKPLPLLVRAKETTPPSTRTGGRLISELASLNGVNDGLIFTVENPRDGMNYKGTFAQFKGAIISAKAYGLLYTEDGDTSSPEASQTSTGTMALLTTWRANGASSGTSVDHTADKIVVDNGGVYQIELAVSFSGDANSTYECEIYHDNVSASPTPTATGFKLVRKLGVGGDVGSASLIGLVEMDAGDGVMIYMRSTDGGTEFLTHNAQLMVTQI